MVSIAALQNLPFLLQYMCRPIYHKTLLSNIKVLNYSHNSPEYCPCPLVPRNSACSVAVHCCGCRGPSVLRGPVEPLEEPVPELWPPGEGNDGLLYGRHPSSKSTHIGTKRHTLSLNFYFCSYTSCIWCMETKSTLHPPPHTLDICRVAVPTSNARACHGEDSQLRTWPCSHHPYDEGKYNNRGTTGCCGTSCCRAT